MPIPELVKLAAIRAVERFCERRVPEHAREQVRLEFLVRGNSITLVERRAPWRPEYGPDWSSLKVAQFRYDATAGNWSLYCCDRNERWFAYSGITARRDVAPLLAEIDADPTGIFWG